ncbi:MFS transporter [Bathymodiolus japonicus methanotrophic gill symbiont]|uniref:MFS transporter n=1 Tax=Bathymodiolus japonicus methanotrophic gill symbiont TaxID=113269 RepID=UPI001E521F83|nr:MFS transporter [Bathymodiolus japonicus methanotrophic gill symbiont]
MNEVSMQQVTPMAERRELISWALYDFANSGYTTVVMSTIYSTYFVGVIAVSSVDMVAGMPTLLWSIAIGLANFVVMIIGPVVGALADHQARKKIFLLISSIGCVLATALLAFVEPGEVLLSMLLVTISAIMFAQGENLIAAFLPELVPKEKMGRMSGYGWSVGYFGGLLTLGLCLWLITWGQQQGMADTDIIPLTLLLTAGIFAVSVMPTFLWLRERAVAQPEEDISYFRLSFSI